MSTGLQDLHHLRRCRANVAEARIAVQTAKDAHEYERGMAEFRACAAGRNADERKTALLVALAGDVAYQRVLSALRAAEAELIRSEAELETAQDQRRESEWAVRAALVNALAQRQIFAEADDGAFDAAGDEEAYQELTEADDEDDDGGMSRGDPDSAFDAQQRRPQPTYAADDDERPF